MDIAIRKIIYKISLLHSLCKSLVEFQNKRFYEEIIRKGKGINRINLTSLPRKKRCFIVGNGPSLTPDDLDMLVDEDCFAANLIFKVFNKTVWRPRYYFIQDRYARVGDFLNSTKIPYLFIGDYFWRCREVSNPNAYCFHTEYCRHPKEVKFSYNPQAKLYDVCTVTYSMIQIAFAMGYKEIYLIGIDHNYPIVFDEFGKVKHVSDSKSHFFNDDKPQEVIANLLMMEAGYKKAKEVAEISGIKILNATRGGNLEIFQRVNLEESV